jgi:hypothetical protein
MTKVHNDLYAIRCKIKFCTNFVNVLFVYQYFFLILKSELKFITNFLSGSEPASDKIYKNPTANKNPEFNRRKIPYTNIKMIMTLLQ